MRLPKQKLVAQNFEPISTTPEQFGTFIRADGARCGKMAKRSHQS